MRALQKRIRGRLRTLRSLKRNRWIAVLSALTVGLVVSDILIELWVRYPLTASLLASVLVIAVTVLVLDEILANRDIRRWSFVAAKALEEVMSMAVTINMKLDDWAGRLTYERGFENAELVHPWRQVGFVLDRYTHDHRSYSEDQVRAALREALKDREPWRQLLPVVGELRHQHESTLATWGPFLLANPRLADLAQMFQDLSSRLEWLVVAIPNLDLLEGDTPEAWLAGFSWSIDDPIDLFFELKDALGRFYERYDAEKERLDPWDRLNPREPVSAST